MKYNIKDLLTDIGDLGRDIYQGYRRNKGIYELALLIGGTGALGGISGCSKDDPPHTLRTEEELSRYVESYLNNSAEAKSVKRVDKDLRMPITIPYTGPPTNWVTFNADYMIAKATGDTILMEAVSDEDAKEHGYLHMMQAVKTAKKYNMQPNIRTINRGLPKYIDNQLQELGFNPGTQRRIHK